MGNFKNNLKDDDAYINGIGRFDIEVNSDADVEWSQSESDNLLNIRANFRAIFLR